MVGGRRALFAVLVLAVGGALLVAGPAAAKAPTTVVVSFKFPAFHGTLKSPNAGCKAGRSVKLFKVRPGPDKLLKRGTSNKMGRWSTPIGKPVPSGTYYVKAAFRGKCKAAKSRLIPVA